MYLHLTWIESQDVTNIRNLHMYVVFIFIYIIQAVEARSDLTVEKFLQDFLRL